MSENSTTNPEPEFVAFVGIDWADQKHAWCSLRAGATQREHGEVEHTPEMVEVRNLTCSSALSLRPAAAIGRRSG